MTTSSLHVKYDTFFMFLTYFQHFVETTLSLSAAAAAATTTCKNVLVFKWPFKLYQVKKYDYNETNLDPETKQSF